jgi:protein subunit release factor B
MNCVLCRGVAKLVKASDFDSDMRRFESFFPCQMFSITSSFDPLIKPHLPDTFLEG